MSLISNPLLNRTAEMPRISVPSSFGSISAVPEVFENPKNKRGLAASFALE